MTKRTPPLSSSGKSKLPSRGSGNLLDILRSSVPDLNNGEAKVARIILANTEWVSHASIKAVADRAAVSEPTVLRMCRRIGLEGFKALKHRLAQDLSNGVLNKFEWRRRVYDLAVVRESISWPISA